MGYVDELACSVHRWYSEVLSNGKVVWTCDACGLVYIARGMRKEEE